MSVDFSTKFENLDLSLNEKMSMIRKMMHEVDNKMKLKVDKD
jgi:hypothetical protein